MSKIDGMVEDAKAQAMVEAMFEIGNSKDKKQLVAEIVFITLYLQAHHPEILRTASAELDKALNRHAS